MKEVSANEITDVLLDVTSDVLLKSEVECIAHSLLAKFVISKKELDLQINDLGGNYGKNSK